MTLRRLLPLLALIALLVAPLGRVAAAETMAMPQHGAAASTHCDDMPAPAPDKADRSIDCMTACAVVVALTGTSPQALMPAASAPVLRALPLFAGLHPEADPPPPRLS